MRAPLLALMLAALVAGCGTQEEILPGQRSDIRPGQNAANLSLPVALPAPRANGEWTHRGGGPDHLIVNPALGPALQLAFAVNIGEGNSRRLRITADPVVAGGRVFTLDASALVTGLTTGGEMLWQTDLTPPGEGRADASGGGLAAAGGALYVSTGFGELVAMDAATGGVYWRQRLDVPAGSAPLVAGDLVYVAARGSLLMALERDTGRIAWQSVGTPSAANFAGGAGAAFGGGMLVAPFPTGELRGYLPRGGEQRWSAIIAGSRPGEAQSLGASDIAADPVIAGGVVYVGNYSGALVALRLDTGARLWTVTEGATSPVTVAGGSVFLINSVGELVRRSASDGALIWRQPLPGYEESRERRRATRYVHYGPLLAGGRLIVASSDGTLRQFDPASGALIGQQELPGGAASHPVVANGILYVVSAAGQLLAFR